MLVCYMGTNQPFTKKNPKKWGWLQNKQKVQKWKGEGQMFSYSMKVAFTEQYIITRLYVVDYVCEGVCVWGGG